MKRKSGPRSGLVWSTNLGCFLSWKIVSFLGGDELTCRTQKCGGFEANLGMLSVGNSFRVDENVRKINLAYMSTQQVKCVHETQNCLSPMLHMKPALR